MLTIFKRDWWYAQAMTSAPNPIQDLDVVIVGGGPAGLTAAIYTGRANLSTLILEKGLPGGQIAQTEEVENYPGFPDPIPGMELAERMVKQAEKFGARIEMDEVESIESTPQHHPYLFTVRGYSGTYRAKSVILSTGANPKRLNVPGEEAYWGRGVSTCATCDGFFYRGQEVAVVGGGNTAVEEALYLSNIANKVTIIHRRDKFRAEAILIDRLNAKAAEGKIVIKYNHTLEEVVGNESGVTGVQIKSTEDGTITPLTVHGLFVAIGHKPNTAMFEGQLDMHNGYIKTKTGLEGMATATNIPGVFAAGDVQDHIYRQAITSAGTGCMAALDAQRYLESLED
jgi:thioredoxin reductase (NADPH)